MRCAVGNCKQSNSKKSTSGKSVSFYNFPRDVEQRKRWILFCNNSNTTNTRRDKICSLHFQEDDFERNFQFEMGFSNRRAPKLKPGTIPTIASAVVNKFEISSTPNEKNITFLTTAKSDVVNKVEKTTCNEKNISMKTEIVEDNQRLHIKNLEMKISVLRQENAMLKTTQTQSATRIKNLSRQVQRLSFTNDNLEKTLRRWFTEGQIKKLKNGNKRQNFTETDIAQAITLYSTSARAYKLLKKNQFPLPSVRTLQRWSQKLHASTDTLEPVSNQMLCVLDLDEMQAKKNESVNNLNHIIEMDRDQNSETASGRLDFKSKKTTKESNTINYTLGNIVEPSTDNINNFDRIIKREIDGLLIDKHLTTISHKSSTDRLDFKFENSSKESNMVENSLNDVVGQSKDGEAVYNNLNNSNSIIKIEIDGLLIDQNRTTASGRSAVDISVMMQEKTTKEFNMNKDTLNSFLAYPSTDDKEIDVNVNGSTSVIKIENDGLLIDQY